MQIACPQCSMTYTLDARLLPPGGAPVQCTQCNHVFIAHPLAGGAEGEEPRRTDTAPSGLPTPSARASTRVFGAAAPGEAPGRTGTQVFGAPGGPSAPAAAEAPSEPPPTPARRGTQVFGAVAPPEPPPRSRTLVMGAITPEAPRSASTQIFGAVGAQLPGPVEPPRDRGAPDAPAIPPVPPDEQGRTPNRRATQLFAAPAVPPAVPPVLEGGLLSAWKEAAEPGTPPRPGQQGPGPVDLGQVAIGQAAIGQAGVSRGEALERPPGPAAPGRTPPARPRVELPSEPELLPIPGGAVGQRARPASFAPRSPGRVRRLALLAAGGLLAVLLGVGAWKLLAPRPYQAPAAAQLARDDAARLLRRDDAVSRGQAIAQLEALVASEPQFLDARSDLVVALAFQLDDVKLALRELKAEQAALSAQVARFEAEQMPGDWQNRVNALREQLAEVERRRAPLNAQAGELEARLHSAVASLGSVHGQAGEPPTVVRAHAVYHGVRGSGQVLELTERYRQRSAADGWGDIAYAEYVLNAAAGQAGLEQARAALHTLREQDASFVRLYVLDARLALLAGDTEAARTGLDAVLTLNPEHALARQMRSRLQEGGLVDGR